MVTFWIIFIAYWVTSWLTLRHRYSRLLAVSNKACRWNKDKRERDAVEGSFWLGAVWPVYYTVIYSADLARWLVHHEDRATRRKTKEQERRLAEEDRQMEIRETERHLKAVREQFRDVERSRMLDWDKQFKNLEHNTERRS